ncbi:MAG TPA: endonuclease MutS2 [Candidatus Cloacimonadota bacterium]|nr:endonuclease MutS2 [Candidatus Cloacimonadota bacterium]HPS39144.1 endonuclease MutS2 [Candidatus Cloacimonadota bacterium]
MNDPLRYSDLEYEKIVEQIVLRAQSVLGRQRARELHPQTDQREIIRSQTLVYQIQNALDDGYDCSFEELADVGMLFGDNVTGVYGFEEFFFLYRNTKLANRLAELTGSFPEQSEFWKLLRRLRPFPELAKRFEQIFDPEGEVMDTASPELLRIRRSIHGLRSRIQKTMNGMLSDPRFANYIQDKFITQRDDRYVLPIKESGAPIVKGIVQSQSGSGSTLFIEPEAVVPLNNDLQILKQDEKQEIFRIFRSYTDDYRSVKPEVIRNMETLAELDFRYACARLCRVLGARIPKLSDQPVLKFISARHPLLILRLGNPREVIPFDLELGTGYRFLVLSGPNTGGKTVLMKAVGLLTLMALSGLPIPADEDSRVGCFSSVFADIGDDQSIESALSTFSSHLDKISRMLSQSDPNSLVLIDEIGAATDPQQGSAIAQAVMEGLIERQCRGIVTTHYTALKVYAERAEGCVNASMQFDLKSLHPTYRFEIGFPGDSFAIEVAASLGMSPELILRARELSGSQNLELGELLRKLENEKKSLAREHYQYQLKNRNLDARLQELETRESSLEEELKARKQTFLKELQKELIAQQKIYQRELDELKKLDKDERKVLSERKLHTLSERNRELTSSLSQAATGNRNQVFEPKVGDKVWLPNFEADAVILDIRGSEALVDMNGISFKSPLNALYESSAKVEKALPPSGGRGVAPNSGKYELKLLGLTFDEAQPLIDEFIDDAILSGLHSLRIVHGKGTGALRNKVRGYLMTKRQVIAIDTPPMNEGGSGVTIVKI